MEIPFVDLYAQYRAIQAEVDQAIAEVIRTSAFISGPSAARFEEAFARYCGMNHCVACANGTDSLEMILRAAGIGAGDEVIVPAVSWISTSEAVSSVGAVPVFVDVDQDLLINAELIEDKIGDRTRAIIPVHLYGNPVDMEKIMAIANAHSLFVLEDCAQSHGAAIRGKKAGSFGHAASYSFYPGKNLGAYGDAGAVVTNDQNLADRIRTIANHGQRGKHNHIMEGRNSRMDGIQASVLSVKLPHLENWTEQRISRAAYYRQKLQHLPLDLPHLRDDARHVFHLFVIQTERRDDLNAFLQSRGISCGIHYPFPLPLLPCYAHLGYSAEEFPGASQTSRILSLPMYAELTNEQIDHIAQTISEWYGA